MYWLHCIWTIPSKDDFEDDFFRALLVSDDELQTGRLKGRSGIDAPDEKNYHPGNHINDSTS
jgi:hypothetical protein